MKRKARLLTLPRAIANADSNAAVTALANPVTKNFSGWRTLLRGEKVTSTNAVINGAKKMMIPRILDIMSNPSSTQILLLTSPHNVALSGQGRATRAHGPLQREVRRPLDSRCSHNRGLPYDLVRPLEQPLRNRQAQSLRGLEIDHQLELRWLLDGQVGGLGPFEDLVHVGGCTAVEVRKVRSIGHQTAGHNPFPYAKHARQVPLGDELNDVLSVHSDERILQDEERIRVRLGRAGECALKVLRAPHVLCVQQESQRTGRRLRLVPRRLVGRIRRIPEDRHTGHAWNDLFQQLQPFPTEFWGKGTQPREVPPGRARLATNPAPTGSIAVGKTIGIVWVACLAAIAAGVVCTRMISTLSWTISAANFGKRSALPSENRRSKTTFRPSLYPRSRNPFRSASHQSAGGGFVPR